MRRIGPNIVLLSTVEAYALANAQLAAMGLPTSDQKLKPRAQWWRGGNMNGRRGRRHPMTGRKGK